MPPVPGPLSIDAALFLDFDGTLVEIAPRPETIHVASDLRDILLGVKYRLNGALAIVSGRSIAAIDRYLDGTVTAVAGIHGAECRDASGRIARISVDRGLLNSVRAELSHFVGLHHGVQLEDKDISLSLHFRNAPEYAEKCQKVIDACASNSHGVLERIDGHMVVELKPVGSDKGKAVENFLRMPPFAGRKPIYVGDDITDEFAFATVARVGGLGIAVGPRQAISAVARLEAVADVHRWLGAFARDHTIAPAL